MVVLCQTLSVIDSGRVVFEVTELNGRDCWTRTHWERVSRRWMVCDWKLEGLSWMDGRGGIFVVVVYLSRLWMMSVSHTLVGGNTRMSTQSQQIAHLEQIITQLQQITSKLDISTFPSQSLLFPSKLPKHISSRHTHLPHSHSKPPTKPNLHKFQSPSSLSQLSTPHSSQPFHFHGISEATKVRRGGEERWNWVWNRGWCGSGVCHS